MTYSAKDDEVLQHLLFDYTNASENLADATLKKVGEPFFAALFDAAEAELFTHIDSKANTSREDALTEEVEALRAALTKAQRQFRFYADEHFRAGKYEKHATNQEYVMMIDAALKGKDQ